MDSVISPAMNKFLLDPISINPFVICGFYISYGYRWQVKSKKWINNAFNFKLEEGKKSEAFDLKVTINIDRLDMLVTLAFNAGEKRAGDLYYKQYGYKELLFC